jgi:mono/diheme cytochrome c family protein
MTDRPETRRAFGRRVVLPLMASGLLLACEAHVGTGPSAPYQSEGPNDPNNMWTDAAVGDASVPNSVSPPPSNKPKDAGPGDPNDPPEDDPVAAMCATAALDAQKTLTNHCSGCHGQEPNAKAGFSTVLDVPALVTSGKIVPNEPTMSPVFKRLQNGSMPPMEVATRPDNAAISAVELWIKCGATDWNQPAAGGPAFVDIDKRLRWVLEDLRALPNPIDRQRMRYIDISTLANGGANAEQLTIYREAVSMLMNSLSRGRSVVAPKAVDAGKLLYRIDLRDYLWDDTSWRQLEEIYPYAVVYDRDSRLFPYDEVTSEQIRLETGTQIPIIQADWFISHASRPPLYYDLLNLPETLQGLEQQLGVDVQQNIDSEQVLRSGFANAGPSQNNRVIERHELGGNRGALWLSYDFANNLGNRNIFAHPLDFQEDGGEMIFNLDNGLQGYFIADAAGTRLDKAPNNVVQDPDSRDGTVEAGLSCMNCHQVDGQLEKPDEIRDFQLSAGANANEIEQVLALYVPYEELKAAFDADINRYRNSRAALSIKRMNNATMHQLDNRHLGVIGLDGIAAVIGLRADELRRAIDASPQAFPPEIVTLRTPDGGIQRDSFEAIFADLIQGLGLGQQLLATRGSVQLPPEPAPQPEPEPQPQPEPQDAGVASDASTPESDFDRESRDRRGN